MMEVQSDGSKNDV